MGWIVLVITGSTFIVVVVVFVLFGGIGSTGNADDGRVVPVVVQPDLGQDRPHRLAGDQAVDGDLGVTQPEEETEEVDPFRFGRPSKAGRDGKDGPPPKGGPF